MSERSMGVLQEADEERARRKDNPMTDEERAKEWLTERLGPRIKLGLDDNHIRDLAALLSEVRREEVARVLVVCNAVSKAVREERERIKVLVLKAEADIKALGFEAHPAVTMRLDRLLRELRCISEEE